MSAKKKKIERQKGTDIATKERQMTPYRPIRRLKIDCSPVYERWPVRKKKKKNVVCYTLCGFFFMRNTIFVVGARRRTVIKAVFFYFFFIILLPNSIDSSESIRISMYTRVL